MASSALLSLLGDFLPLPPLTSVPLSGTGWEVKGELHGLAGKRYRHCRRARGLTLPTGQRRGGLWLPGLPNNPGTKHPPLALHGYPSGSHGVSGAVTVIPGSCICSGVGDAPGAGRGGEVYQFYEQ